MLNEGNLLQTKGGELSEQLLPYPNSVFPRPQVLPETDEDFHVLQHRQHSP